jgi:ligand-binding sensor domain-containing protein
MRRASTRTAVSLAALILLASGPACSQDGTWTNYTSMRNVSAVARTGSTIWAATSGGLFGWQREADHFERYTAAEGLRDIALSAMAVDNEGMVWTGSATGILHRLIPSSSQIQINSDIATSDQINRAILRLKTAGDTLLICTEFGLSIFRIRGFEFGDTFTRFGSIPSSTRTSVFDAEVLEGRIWIALSDGLSTHAVASADRQSPNLLPPDAWTLEAVGSPGNVVRQLAVFAGTLYAGSADGLYRRSASGWEQLPGFALRTVTALASGSSLIVCTSDDQVSIMEADGTISTYGGVLPSAAAGVTADAAGLPVVGSAELGLLDYGQQWQSHLPEGPAGSSIAGLAATSSGALWCASGTVNGSGIYLFDPPSWTTIDRSSSALPLDDVYRVSVAPDGTVWASTFGRGLVAFPGGIPVVDSANIFNTNVGMVGLPNDMQYVVPSNAVTDGAGNVWATIINAADRNVLAVREPGRAWRTLPAIINGVRVSTLTEPQVDLCLAVDASNNLWSVVRDGAFRGVLSLNNGGAVDSVAAFLVTAATGLPSDDVRTIVVDRENDIWVGTSRGISIILEPSAPTRPGAIASYRPLNGLTVNTIAVDPLNRKWVGTTEGVILLSPDGTQVLETYTVQTSNGRLISDEVRSIAVDPLRGTVYFGTDEGLAGLTTAAAAPQASFGELVVYPNPYLVPSTSPVTVDGLVENSSLRILTIDGALVRDLATPGGRVGFWDGKDEQGRDVSSGIYLVVAYSDDGANVANGKIAVIRR